MNGTATSAVKTTYKPRATDNQGGIHSCEFLQIHTDSCGKALRTVFIRFVRAEDDGGYRYAT
jgi:hypothetical protein